MKRSIGVACFLMLASVSLLVGGTLRPDGRFDDRVVYRVGGSIGVEATFVESFEPDDTLRLGWDSFRESHGGSWKVMVDGRTGMPTRVSGSGIALFADGETPAELDTVAAVARTFLDQNDALLGEWGPLLELDLEASGRLSSDHWQLVFRQNVDGVRVENARLDMHIKRGRLVLFGAAHWGAVKTSATPTLDAVAARAVLDDHLGVATAGFEQIGEPELVLIAVAAGAQSHEPTAWTGSRGKGVTHTLVWRFRIQEPGTVPLWVGEVDAHAGLVRTLYDDARYAAVRGGVFPVSADDDCANGGCEVAGYPMPFADFTETGEVEEYTDAFGNLVCVDDANTVETNLIGPYVRIEDGCGVVSETAVCDEDLDLGLNFGINCDVDPAGSPGNSAAARTAYYHVNRAAELARFYNTTSPWLTEELTVKVNQGGSCNAFWSGGTLRMLQEGNGCNNTGELSGVLVHEWGHGYDFNDGGGEDVPSEAYADVVAIFANRASCVSRGWYNDGRTCTGYGDTCLTCTGIRDHDWAARLNNTPTTPLNFSSSVCPSGPGGPCGREPHCEAYPIGETIFDLATRDLPASGLDQDTAWQLAERLWYMTRLGAGDDIFDCFRPWLSHSCFTYNWYQRMLVADDDDGDLANGTPHAAALFAAFDRHEISCGNVDDPENQSTSSCPALSAPLLSLVEMPSGTQLSWPAIAGAGEVRVYRGERGCDVQQIPIASLPGGSTSFLDDTADPSLPRFYRVEAFGASPSCHSPVSSCEATPLSARVQPAFLDIVESGVVNGIPDPGETVTLPVTVFNPGLDTSTVTTGTLTFVDPSQGQVLDGQVSWADVPPGGTALSDAPHFEVQVSDTVNCGETVLWNVDASASNSVTTRKQFSVVLGVKDRDFPDETDAVIPAETVTPVEVTMVVAEDEVIDELDVSISIGHDTATELVVDLTSPEGTTVRLHDQSAGTSQFGLDTRYDEERLPDGPGGMADFAGESSAGTWTLSIEDVGALSTGDGTFQRWELHVRSAGAFDCEEASCAAAPPTVAPDGLTVDKTPNGPELDLDFSWNPVAGVAGYHLLQSTDKTFAAGVQLAGSTTGATTLTLPDGAATTPPLAFFQVRATNECGVEGP